MTANEEKFRAVYAVKLSEAMDRHPEEYLYPKADIPVVVDKMIPSLARGGASLGPAVKATARALGIKPTYASIKEYLGG